MARYRGILLAAVALVLLLPAAQRADAQDMLIVDGGGARWRSGENREPAVTVDLGIIDSLAADRRPNASRRQYRRPRRYLTLNIPQPEPPAAPLSIGRPAPAAAPAAEPPSKTQMPPARTEAPEPSAEPKTPAVSAPADRPAALPAGRLPGGTDGRNTGAQGFSGPGRRESAEKKCHPDNGANRGALRFAAVGKACAGEASTAAAPDKAAAGGIERCGGREPEGRNGGSYRPAAPGPCDRGARACGGLCRSRGSVAPTASGDRDAREAASCRLRWSRRPAPRQRRADGLPWMQPAGRLPRRRPRQRPVPRGFSMEPDERRSARASASGCAALRRRWPGKPVST